MKAVFLTPRIVAWGLSLAVLLSATIAVAYSPYFFAISFLRGRWSFQLEPAKSFATDAASVGDPGGLETAPRQDLMRVGIMDFDGAGNVSGHSIATTDDNSGNTVVIDFTWKGTYALNADGTGTLSIVTLFIDNTSCTPAQPTCATFEGTETYGFSISKKFGTITFVQQDNPGGGAKIFLRGEAVRQSNGVVPLVVTTTRLKKRWEFQLVPAKSFATDAAACGDAITNYSSACDPGGLQSAPRQDVLRVGVMDFDGAGNVSGHTIATTDDNSGNTVVIDMKQWTGTYSMSPANDGTGTLNIVNPNVTDVDCTPGQMPLGTCATFEGPETYAFSYSKSRQRLYLIQTDNAGGGAKIFMRGRADLQ